MLVNFPPGGVALLLAAVVYVSIHSLARRRAPSQAKNFLRIHNSDAMRIANLADHSPRPLPLTAQKLAFSIIAAGNCEVYYQ
jgi:hypothetical protein